MRSFLLILFLFILYQNCYTQKIIKDIDGNEYLTVVIGNQEWLNRNLQVVHYNDGTPILLVQDHNWSNLKTGAYCFYTDQENFKEVYGLLYNFYAVNNKQLCPDGWHVPTKIDWEQLINYLGGDKKAGAVMKDIQSGYWTKHNQSNNNSGFSALPAGGRGKQGEIGEVGLFATWWSSTSYDMDYAWHWGLYPEKNDIRFNPGHKNSGFSVRCIKD